MMYHYFHYNQFAPDTNSDNNIEAGNTVLARASNIPTRTKK